jgi:A/G-specific adenine glycosylase
LQHRIERIRLAAAAVRDTVPHTRSGLLEIPGVGPYAAAAVLCFAYGRRVPIVDPNVIRILERLLARRSSRSRPRTDPSLWSTAKSLMPTRDARAWNYALLDLGALVCRPQPRCFACPLQALCATGRLLDADASSRLI